MMEIENEVKFEIGIDGMRFDTKSNGDRIFIRDVHMTPTNAATLAYLINKKVILEIEIKEKGT